MKVKYIAALISAGVLLAVTISGCNIIPPGKVGVKTSLGKVNNSVLNPGLHLTVPLVDWVSTFSTKDIAKPDTYYILTKDGQKIKLTATSKYRIVSTTAPSILSKIGSRPEDIDATILQPALLSAVKDIGSYNTMSTIIENQGKVSVDVEKSVKQKLGENPYIDFISFSVTGFDLDPEVQKSIEEKQIAAQHLERKQTEIDIARQEQDRLTILQKALTPEVLMDKALDKWDGKGIPPTAGTDLNLFINPKK